MPDLQTILETRLRAATVAAFGNDHAAVDPLIRPANNPQHGDFQANLAMSLAKKLGHQNFDFTKTLPTPSGLMVQ